RTTRRRRSWGECPTPARWSMWSWYWRRKERSGRRGRPAPGWSWWWRARWWSSWSGRLRGRWPDRWPERWSGRGVGWGSDRWWGGSQCRSLRVVGRLRERAARLAHALVGPDPGSARQGFTALLISSGGDLLAGVTLGSIQHTLEQLPGLLVLIPAAIGMRGNIFGALGSRLGTAIHTGTFTLSRRRSTVVGQNVLSSLTLTFVVSLALATLAKSIAVAFNLRSISLLDFVVISMVGGIISSAVVLAITVAVAAGSARYGWDMDSVAAPIITAAGDMVTLPSLFLATYCVEVRFLSPFLGVVTAGLAAASVVGVVRSGLPLMRRIVAESL